jgi:hypothetical protein
MFQIEREANVIAKETRRGKGNFVVCSSDVASALAMGGFLNLTPALQPQLEVDDTGNTFAGILNGKFKVYIDPYATLGANFCPGRLSWMQAHTTLACSTAHTYRYKWYVQSIKTLSNPRSASRLVTAW